MSHLFPSVKRFPPAAAQCLVYLWERMRPLNILNEYATLGWRIFKHIAIQVVTCDGALVIYGDPNAQTQCHTIV